MSCVRIPPLSRFTIDCLVMKCTQAFDIASCGVMYVVPVVEEPPPPPPAKTVFLKPLHHPLEHVVGVAVLRSVLNRHPLCHVAFAPNQRSCFCFAVGESPSPPKNRNSSQSTYVSYQNMRRAQTPNPELSTQGLGMNTPQRRAVTPGPEWARPALPGHYNSTEDVSGARDNSAHFRQPSFLTAMDSVNMREQYNQSYPQSSGFGAEGPYCVGGPSRGHYPLSSTGEDGYSRAHTLPARSSAYYPNQQQSNVPHYSAAGPRHEAAYPAPSQSHSTQGSQYANQYPAQSRYQQQQQQQQYPAPNGYTPNQQQQQQQQQGYPTQDHGASQSGHNYMNIPPSYQGTHVPNSQQPQQQQQQQQQQHPPPRPPQPRRNSKDLIPPTSEGYNDWTLSTSEQYRRQGPVSPRKEKPEFSYPNPSSPQRAVPVPTPAQGGVQRMDSFTKEGNGADVIRYQRRETPGDQNQRGRRNSQEGVLSEKAPAAPSAPGSKSTSSAEFQNAMKRARSLENTASAAEQASGSVAPTAPAASRPGAPLSRHRPASARPYDYGHQKPVVNHHQPQSQLPQRSASTQPDQQPKIVYPDPEYVTHEELMRQQALSTRLSAGLDTVDGKVGLQAKGSPTKPGSSSPTEDNYATFNMRKQVENILQMQSKLRPKAPAGHPMSSAASHTSSSTSLDTMPAAFKDALQVDIPGDNISISSNMSKSDSGYRSGDRASNSSASSGVDSPLPEGPGGHRHYGKTAFVYGSYDPKAVLHSSNDSLDSAQSGQSCATLTNKSVGGQPLTNIPENVVSRQPAGKDLTKRPEPTVVSPVVTPAYVEQQGRFFSLRRSLFLSLTQIENMKKKKAVATNSSQNTQCDFWL